VERWQSWPSQQEPQRPPMPYPAIAAAGVLGAGIVLGFVMVIQGTPTPMATHRNERPERRPNQVGQSTQWPWVKATTNAAISGPDTQR